jgi:hypothetical protein
MILRLKPISNKFFEKAYESAMSDLNKFFGMNWTYNRPNIYLINNRKDYDLIRGQKTESWMVGYVGNNNVFVLDYRNFEKESCHKYSKEYYSALIKHELAHIFTQQKGLYYSHPTWLWEGIAIFASDQLNQYKRPEKLKNFLRFYKIHKDEIGSVYGEAGFAVEFLVKKYGKEKLFELIKAIKKDMSEADFAKLFKKIYNIPLDYKSFNN